MDSPQVAFVEPSYQTKQNQSTATSARNVLKRKLDNMVNAALNQDNRIVFPYFTLPEGSVSDPQYLRLAMNYLNEIKAVFDLEQVELGMDFKGRFNACELEILMWRGNCAPVSRYEVLENAVGIFQLAFIKQLLLASTPESCEQLAKKHMPILHVTAPTSSVVYYCGLLQSNSSVLVRLYHQYANDNAFEGVPRQLTTENVLKAYETLNEQLLSSEGELDLFGVSYIEAWGHLQKMCKIALKNVASIKLPDVDRKRAQTGGSVQAPQLPVDAIQDVIENINTYFDQIKQGASSIFGEQVAFDAQRFTPMSVAQEFDAAVQGYQAVLNSLSTDVQGMLSDHVASVRQSIRQLNEIRASHQQQVTTHQTKLVANIYAAFNDICTHANQHNILHDNKPLLFLWTTTLRTDTASFYAHVITTLNTLLQSNPSLSTLVDNFISAVEFCRDNGQLDIVGPPFQPIIGVRSYATRNSKGCVIGVGDPVSGGAFPPPAPRQLGNCGDGLPGMLDFSGVDPVLGDDPDEQAAVAMALRMSREERKDSASDSCDDDTAMALKMSLEDQQQSVVNDLTPEAYATAGLCDLTFDLMLNRLQQYVATIVQNKLNGMLSYAQLLHHEQCLNNALQTYRQTLSDIIQNYQQGPDFICTHEEWCQLQQDLSGFGALGAHKQADIELMQKQNEQMLTALLQVRERLNSVLKNAYDKSKSQGSKTSFVAWYADRAGMWARSQSVAGLLEEAEKLYGGCGGSKKLSIPSV